MVLRTVAIVFIVLFIGWELLLLAFYLRPHGPAALVFGHHEGLWPSVQLMGLWDIAALVLLVFSCVFWQLAIWSGRHDASEKR